MSVIQQRIMGLGVFNLVSGAFTTTATTDEISCKGYQKVISLGPPTVFGAAIDAQDINIYIDETKNADGSITVPASGNITILRPASGATGLSWTWAFIGI